MASSGLKRRPSGLELAGALAPLTGDLPSTSGRVDVQSQAEPPKAIAQPAPQRVELVQVNFRVSKGLAKLLARLSEERGSTRRLIAQLLQSDGHEVPEVDLVRPETRRRYDE
ncbi:hypothetical protein QWZ14_09060 [Paeniroseomonas aquatica]|uniref:Uncharacterized protein n=1 Tax=Paeniroseomonas aquatica TaxID=373043 RepID=A0ABT8A540_9PROT|nr:hypothetical protein [Paeniroseomonas aquatica]MDN3564511.1 hypothetical protein [Paeniroseomonas aquatica]